MCYTAWLAYFCMPLQVFDEWVDEEEVLGEVPGTSFSAIYALNPNLDPVDPLLNKALQSNLIQLRKYGPIPVRVSAQAHLTNGMYIVTAVEAISVQA
mgnify:CR=1 FL=1